MVSEEIRAKIESRFGKVIRYPMDCDELSMDIYKATTERISSSTLKRVLGFYKETKLARLHTLDVIAKYLGYPNWDYLNNRDENSSDILIEGECEIGKLIAGTALEIHYSPDRVIHLLYLGENSFNVVYSNTDKLLAGNNVKIYTLLRGHTLTCRQVTRNGMYLGTYIGGRKSGITYINVSTSENSE